MNIFLCSKSKRSFFYINGATFSGIQFSGGDLSAISDTAHEFYTYRFDEANAGATANLSDVKIYCALHDPTKAWTLADRGTDNRHAGYKASGGWNLFAARWGKYMKGKEGKPNFADYKVVSAHQPGVIYYCENMLNNITEEFTGAQTRETSCTVIPNETYNVNEFFSDKRSIRCIRHELGWR